MAGGHHYQLVAICPDALRMANDVSNLTPMLRGQEHISSLEMFSQVEVKPQGKHHAHTFGSPVYVLDEKIQSGQRKPKWEHKACVGIYLGTSPRHSRKVSLVVLNLQTGHLSPQFHCQFHDLCDNLRPSAGNPEPQSRWQEKAGFLPGRATTNAREITEDIEGSHQPILRPAPELKWAEGVPDEPEETADGDWRRHGGEQLGGSDRAARH
jgi:hypothetical protein